MGQPNPWTTLLWTKCTIVPSNFCDWLWFFPWQCGELTTLPQTSYVGLRGDEKSSPTTEGNGWNRSGAITLSRRGRGGRGKSIGIHHGWAELFSRGSACGRNFRETDRNRPDAHTITLLLVLAIVVTNVNVAPIRTLLQLRRGGPALFFEQFTVWMMFF